MLPVRRSEGRRRGATSARMSVRTATSINICWPTSVGKSDDSRRGALSTLATPFLAYAPCSLSLLFSSPRSSLAGYIRLGAGMGASLCEKKPRPSAG